MNVYAQVTHTNFNKIYNLYNLDPRSETYGLGDREYWGWKIKDFANGSMQGGIHTLAISLKIGLIEDATFVLKIIDAAILVINNSRAKNGSMIEAYPGESSFCVTALVAFDVLSTIKHLEERISSSKKLQYLEVVKPLIQFIINNDEKHAIISNHIATAVAALALWNKFTGEGKKRYDELLQVIYDNQSVEGWYKEYEGSDPGYQTLCNYYLFCTYEETKCPQLLHSLEKSLEYLKYFVHPDGTIGGLYGSRNTEVYYPGGIVGLTQYSETAKTISAKLEKGIVDGNNLLPQNIDIGNYIPLLNSYAFASLYADVPSSRNYNKLPCEKCGEWKFTESGIFISSAERYYAIVNFHKGGTIKVFDKETDLLDIEDGGLFGELGNGDIFSTQIKDSTIDFSDKTLKAGFYKVNKSSPTLFTTIILRCLALTLFRFTYPRKIFKQMIVKMLMTGKNRIDGTVTRTFQFSKNDIAISEKISKPKNCVTIGRAGKSRSVHMASSGYYMKPHEQLLQMSKIVTFKTNKISKTQR